VGINAVSKPITNASSRCAPNRPLAPLGVVECVSMAANASPVLSEPWRYRTKPTVDLLPYAFGPWRELQGEYEKPTRRSPTVTDHRLLVGRHSNRRSRTRTLGVIPVVCGHCRPGALCALLLARRAHRGHSALEPNWHRLDVPGANEPSFRASAYVLASPAGRLGYAIAPGACRPLTRALLRRKSRERVQRATTAASHTRSSPNVE